LTLRRLDCAAYARPANELTSIADITAIAREGFVGEKPIVINGATINHVCVTAHSALSLSTVRNWFARLRDIWPVGSKGSVSNGHRC
jgi:hypothetical protein